MNAAEIVIHELKRDGRRVVLHLLRKAFVKGVNRGNDDGTPALTPVPVAGGQPGRPHHRVGIDGTPLPRSGPLCRPAIPAPAGVIPGAPGPEREGEPLRTGAVARMLGPSLRSGMGDDAAANCRPAPRR